MLKNLKLTNFRAHQDREFNFTPGLVVFRGANENGKTSTLESILYAFFGSKGLREPLAKVVTYDKPEASLKVELDFSYDGVDYHIKRGKSGAELTYGDQSVTGQTEVRVFCERLFGCSADTAKQLVIADQNSVRGVLAQGGTAAGSLVERLADLEVIETLIDKIQTQLSSGNTKQLEAQVAQLEQNAEDAPEMPSDAVLQAAQNRWSSATAHKEKFQALWAVCAPERIATDAVLVRAAEVQKERCNAQAVAEKLRLQAVMPAPLSLTQADVDEAAQLVADEAAMAKRRKAYATRFPSATVEWDGDYASMLAAEELASMTKAKQVEEEQQLRVKLATAKATRINEDICSFCKKDISKLPEVAAINEKVSKQEEEYSARIVELKDSIGLLTGELAAYKQLKEVCARIQTLAGDYWTLSNSVPPKATWIGAVPPAEGEVPDVAGMRQQLQDYITKISKAVDAIDELEALVIPELIDVTEAVGKAEEFAKLESELRQAEAVEVQQAESHRTAQQSYNSDMRVYQVKLEQLEKSKQQVSSLKATLQDMYKHNDLIRKLRAARPEIATQLWNTVLGSVSHYFSAIRGTRSVLTRTAEGFAVNGRSVEGLSGSTQDALGLAIRIALSKTFLPGLPLLVLDEPFAGCDEARELAGLGMIAAAGFEQTILITHSDLADALADSLLVI